MNNKSQKAFLTGDFFKLTDNLIGIIDAEGWFIEISPACTTILGYSQEEIIGKSPYHFAHPDDLDHVAIELSVDDRTKSSRQVDYRWRREMAPGPQFDGISN